MPASNADTRKLKICLASWAPFLGGAEVAAGRLAVGLRRAGHDVVVLLGNRGEAFDHIEKQGVRCLYAPTPMTSKWHPWTYLLARARIGRILRRERPDLVHSNDLPTHQIISDAARRLGIPRICHHRWIFDGPAIDWLNKYGAERHLFVSQGLMDPLTAESAKLKASPRAVVYDGLPLPPVPTDADRQQARRELQLPTDKAIVAFTGQIIERKGVADLIRAWSLLPAATRKQSELVIVGDDLAGEGAYRREMETLAAELNVPARFVGFQNNVDRWLISSNIATVPSHAEPLGNATLEAMSLALPVIGGKVGGIPEMVVHEQTGLLVPPRDPEGLAAALERLLTDESLRRQLGQAARSRCEDKFSLQAHVDSVLAQYQFVLPEGTQ